MEFLDKLEKALASAGPCYAENALKCIEAVNATGPSLPKIVPASPEYDLCKKYNLNRTDADIKSMLIVNNFASKNLRHWLEGNGEDMILPGILFQKKVFIIEHLKNQHLEEYKMRCSILLKDIKNNLYPHLEKTYLNNTIKIKPAEVTLHTLGTLRLYWESSIERQEMVDAFEPELYFGLGGFRVFSQIDVAASADDIKNPTNWTVFINKWTCKICDYYNWDSGKKTFIPHPYVMREIEDDEMNCYSNATGKGRSYYIYSEEFDVLTETGTISFIVNNNPNKDN